MASKYGYKRNGKSYKKGEKKEFNYLDYFKNIFKENKNDNKLRKD